MADHEAEQEMEVEALQAILMDDIEEIASGESGLATSARCFQIRVSPMDDDQDEPTDIPVRLAVIFAHTAKYPDEPPLLKVRSLQGINDADIRQLQQKLEEEVQENLGMAMMYTLATSAKEWLREKYGQGDGDVHEEEEDVEKEQVVEPHGEVVTVDSFVAWRDRYEAEIALERAKLMPESVLMASKEKKISGRQWFEMKGGKVVEEEDEEDVEDDEDIDFGDDDEDLDEEDMLAHYLTEKSDKTAIRS
ncbi:hypothetical protein KC19_5G050800 [Ceratodon purpureus]|uniref:RWD domain-containing protein n=1 Tax=Ceratodon purpureus TaxID=3225 RepID=A0A8T0HYU6_CERPU|nr:hypothetical protein KC19_5G050800 [Ceratodon purpureus]